MVLLDALAAREVRATFFVLGLAAEKAPHLVKRIADAGHEVQSHGYGHREQLRSGRGGRPPGPRPQQGAAGGPGRAARHRLPGARRFSIDERNLWVLDVLAETGHRYDSSIFPVKTGRYGIDGYPPEPHLATGPRGGRIVEAPVACFDWLGRRRPVGGGGYFRLWPYTVIRKAWRQLEARGRSGIVYFHPYEYDPSEMASYKGTVSLKQRLHQGLGRGGFPRKVDRLLSEFRFVTMAEALAPLLAHVS